MITNNGFKRMLPLMAMALMIVVFIAGCGGEQAQESAEKQSSSATKTEVTSSPKKEEKKSDEIVLGENGPIEIDYWHIQATIYGEAVQEIITSFNKEYEGKIKVNEVFQGSYGDLNKKIRAALQGGGLPTVSMAYENDTLQYMKADKIVELDSFIEHTEYGLSQEELDDIMPGVLARQRIEAYNGKTMSWPHGNSSTGAYYNTDILKQAGYDKPAETWQEFEKQAIDIYDKTGIPALVIGDGTGYGSYGGSFKTFLETYGIDPIETDLSGVNFNNPQAIELLTILKNLVDKKAILIAENTEQEFTNGRAAIEFGTTARTSTKIELIVGKFQWAMGLIPQGDLTEKTTTLYGGNQVLFKSTPEENLAGWLFLKYFAGPEAQAIYAAKTGYFPATKSAQNTELLKKNYTENPQKEQAFTQVFPHARINVPTAASGMINDAVNLAVQSVYADRATPEEALMKLQVEAEKILSENK